MQTHVIKRTLESVNILNKKLGEGSPQAFALSWIAWEQLLIRVVRVASFEDGWNQVTITNGMKAMVKGRSSFNVSKSIQQFFGVPFVNLSSEVSDINRQVQEFKTLRNLFMHGTTSVHPDKYKYGTEVLTELVSNPGWLAEVEMKCVDGRPKIGDIYRDLRRSSRSFKRFDQDVMSYIRRLDPHTKIYL